MSQKVSPSRRDFLKTSGVLATSLALAGTTARNVHAAGSDEIRLALIGCGGRGNGAIRDRLAVKDNAKVVAVADAFEWSAKNAAKGLREDEEHKSKIDISDDNIFHGLEAYKKATDLLRPGIDQVVIANPPGFRPVQYRYAVEKGVHVFMEKPCCTDALGYKTLVEANEIADKKNLKVCVGLQRRHDPGYREWIAKIHDGLIGDVSYTRVFWNGGGIWCRSRDPGEGELHYQVKNWYHFVYLCGDNINEQHIHNIDVGLWMHGKGDDKCHPVSANAQGGRQNRAASDAVMRSAPPFSDREAWDKWYQEKKNDCGRYGQAWDHFFVEFTFADGSRMFSQCRHVPNCWNCVGQSINGTKGYGQSELGPTFLKDFAGNELFKTNANSGQFRLEHVHHNEAIREDEPMNNGWYAAMSSMTTVLGREAAFSGKIVTWDDLVNKGKVYMPKDGFSSFDETPPVLPDADGFYEGSVAKPGQYNPFVS
ncbi:MAG: Gfo/Idh/MocA family oxidoreductase [Planctomycetaceae bacterium]|nr:Gfo/Idh/MocA family oxidoreductase [Planctomycetaceae bacterium]